MHARQSSESLEVEVNDADQIIVLDGCTDCCAKKKLSASQIIPHRHIIVTEMGIIKNGMAEVEYDEIEKVVQAVMNRGITRYDTTKD